MKRKQKHIVGAEEGGGTFRRRGKHDKQSAESHWDFDDWPWPANDFEDDSCHVSFVRWRVLARLRHCRCPILYTLLQKYFGIRTCQAPSKCYQYGLPKNRNPLCLRAQAFLIFTGEHCQTLKGNLSLGSFFTNHSISGNPILDIFPVFEESIFIKNRKQQLEPQKKRP